jgi:ankyrin repeat protein
MSRFDTIRWPKRLAIAALAFATCAVQAQVAPGVADAARYTGMLGAAHRGDVTKIEKLVANKADVNAVDGYGRTPLHVATFAKQREAIRALAKAGANLSALEQDRYDAVTIASVADDEETLRTLLLSLGASAKLTTSRYDGSALIAAAHLGHDGVVRQLIAAGAPLDHREQPALDRGDRSDSARQWRCKRHQSTLRRR